MGHHDPYARRRVAERTGQSGAVLWLTTRSLTLYVAAVVLRRAWELLNSDVGQLVRRA